MKFARKWLLGSHPITRVSKLVIPVNSLVCSSFLSGNELLGIPAVFPEIPVLLCDLFLYTIFKDVNTDNVLDFFMYLVDLICQIVAEFDIIGLIQVVVFYFVSDQC